MHDVPKNQTLRLPSVDILAFGIGLAALFGHYFYPPLVGLVAVAVFAPSILREAGLLRDADEWTMQITYRAGFHALLVTGSFIFLGYLMPDLGAGTATGPAGSGPGVVFGGETLRKVLIGVFLISYLLQYWGGRIGAFRILLGVAAMNAAPIVAFLMRGGEDRWQFILVAAAASALFVGLAYFVRRWPRAGGGVLLALCVLASGWLLLQANDPRVAWGMLAVLAQVLLVFGVTGVALVRDER